MPSLTIPPRRSNNIRRGNRQRHCPHQFHRQPRHIGKRNHPSPRLRRSRHRRAQRGPHALLGLGRFEYTAPPTPQLFRQLRITRPNHRNRIRQRRSQRPRTAPGDSAPAGQHFKQLVPFAGSIKPPAKTRRQQNPGRQVGAKQGSIGGGSHGGYSVITRQVDGPGETSQLLPVPAAISRAALAPSTCRMSGSDTWFLAATTSARIEMAISGGVRLPI